jgi:hypothetical protein
MKEKKFLRLSFLLLRASFFLLRRYWLTSSLVCVCARDEHNVSLSSFRFSRYNFKQGAGRSELFGDHPAPPPRRQ